MLYIGEGLLIKPFLDLVEALSNQTFDGVEGRLRVGDSLSFGDLAD